MKNKKQKDPFDTLYWLGMPLTDPYQVLACLFAEAPVYELRKLVKKLVSHASRAGVYKCQSVGDVLLYVKLVRSLIKAANAIKKKKQRAVIISEDDWFNEKYYRSHYVTADAWLEFPRHLSKKEYSNPNVVFKKFFSDQPLTSWLQCWEQVVQGAFSSDGACAPAGSLKLYIHLCRLLEAAHLIEVRKVCI